jgi:hypothetical protein
LERLLKARDRLSDEEEVAFDSMAKQAAYRPLTDRQRQWAESAYDRLDLEADRTLNLVSTGQVPRENVPTFEWEKNRPLKPPGRR